MLFETTSPFIIAAVISGIVLIIVALINNMFQIYREKEQHDRQEKSEKQKWSREKVYNSYRKCFEILIKIQQEHVERINNNNLDRDRNISNISKLILEFNLELFIIIADYPNKNFKEFEEELTTIDQSIMSQALIVRYIVMEIMKNDSRIKDVNK